MWKMGTQRIQPIVARDVYVTDSIDHAAEWDCKIFIAQSLVNEHLHEVFWPSNNERGSLLARYLGNAILNICAFPLLPLVPTAWEDTIATWFNHRRYKDHSSLVLLWIFPSGRFASWFISMFALAVMLTFMTPRPTQLHFADVLMAAYLTGISVSEYKEAANALSRYGQLRRYFMDPFNFLDLSLVSVLGLLLIPRQSHARGLEGTFTELELPCQAVGSLLGWMRLLQILFMYSKTGPLLLMALHTLEDLWQFLLLTAIVIVAFGGSFFVLLANTPPPPSPGLDASSHLDALSPLEDLQSPVQPKVQILNVLGVLITAAMKGEPDHILLATGADETLGAEAWAIMYLFGGVVVLLLLNLLIARFAKTFDMVSENVDANFKVAFARIVIEGRKKELVPPPLNLLRLSIDLLHSGLLCNAGLLSLAIQCLRHTCCCSPSEKAGAGLGGGVDMGGAAWGGEVVDGQRLKAGSNYKQGYARLQSRRDSYALEHAEGEQEKNAAAREWVTRCVSEYTDKALSEKQGDTGILSDQVVHFVTTRWFDIGREESWRTDMTRQMGRVELAMGELEAKMSDESRIDALAKRVEQRLEQRLELSFGPNLDAKLDA
uniref:Ion transport domain-containing protein n=1 Tax=Haptolina brevifila TaxID=156173 RepID=A0A7S2DNX5_9EUKA